MGIGIWQLAIILVIVLLVFGAGKLPKVMGDIGKGVKNFKSGVKEVEKSASPAMKDVSEQKGDTEPK